MLDVLSQHFALSLFVFECSLASWEVIYLKRRLVDLVKARGDFKTE